MNPGILRMVYDLFNISSGSNRMKRIVFVVALLLLTSLFCLSPLAVAGQSAANTSQVEYIWKLVETVDYENKEGWDVQNTDTYWKWDHNYAPGNFKARIWHKDDKDYIAYGSVASWSAPPQVIKAGEKVTLTVSLSETENTHQNSASAAATWADFAAPTLGYGSRGQIPFANAGNETDISINGANKSSASDTFTALAPAGSSGQRIAIRQIYYMGTSMATYYVYEWQDGTQQPTPTKTSPPATVIPSKTATTTSAKDPNCVDSGVRFAGLSGQVEVRPGDDEDAWDFAQMGMVLCCEAHIRTGPGSSAILSFKDLSTFVMKADTEIVLGTPPEKETKLQLVVGNIWGNIKQLAKDGTMEVTMNQAVLGIKGTTFVCESTATTSTLKVIEGSVEFRDKVGKTIMVNGGEKVSATSSGMGTKEKFDVALEKQQWEGLTETGTPLNWGLVIGIILVVVVAVAIILVFMLKKRKLNQAN
jgi:hypothetical protein